MLAGVAGVVVAKSALRRLPVVGAVASPLLGECAAGGAGPGRLGGEGRARVGGGVTFMINGGRKGRGPDGFKYQPKLNQTKLNSCSTGRGGSGGFLTGARRTRTPSGHWQDAVWTECGMVRQCCSREGLCGWHRRAATTLTSTAGTLKCGTPPKLPSAGLLPTIIVGPALGIAAVYGLSQNDLFAIRHKLFPPKQPPMRR